MIDSAIAARTALDDIEHRAWVVKKSTWDYMKLLSAQSQMHPGADGYTLEQRQLNSEADRELENLLLSANHWYTAVSRSTVPKEIRKTIKIDKNLKLIVRRLRDIREHWDETRRYFEDYSLDVPPDKKQVIWFKESFPYASPWSSGFSLGIGYYIGGPEVLNLNDILLEVEKVEKLLGR